MEAHGIGILSRMPSEWTAGFLVITGSLAAVAGFIAVTGLRGRGAPACVVILAVFYAAVMVFMPSLLLMPAVKQGAIPGVITVAFLCYIAILMVKMAMLFPSRGAAAARLVFGPWLLALAAQAATGYSPAGCLRAILDETLAAGLLSFTAFWFSFPFIFITNNAGNAGKSLRMRPGLSMTLMLIIAGVLLGGLFLVFHAWRAYLGELNVTWECVPWIAAVAVGVVDEGLSNRRFYRTNM